VLVMQLIYLRNAYCDMQRSINAVTFLNVYRWTRFSDKCLKLAIYTSYVLENGFKYSQLSPRFSIWDTNLLIFLKISISVKMCIYILYT